VEFLFGSSSRVDILWQQPPDTFCRNISWPPKDERKTKSTSSWTWRTNIILTGWVLFPTDDYAVTLVSRNYEALASHYRLTVPPWQETSLGPVTSGCLHRLARGPRRSSTLGRRSKHPRRAPSHRTFFSLLILKPRAEDGTWQSRHPQGLGGSMIVLLCWRAMTRPCALIAPEKPNRPGKLVPGGR